MNRQSNRLISLLLLLAVLLAACSEGATTTTQTTAASQPTSTASADTSPEDTSATTEATSPETTEGEAPAPEGPLERINFRFSFVASPVQVANTFGATSGIYAEHGFDVNVLESSGSSTTMQILASGADDFGSVDGAVYALGKAEGIPVQQLLTWIHRDAAQLIFFCDQNIEDPSDLVGKRIAAPATDAVLQKLPGVLEQYGLTMDDLDITHIAPAARIATIINGDADVGVGFGNASGLLYGLEAERANAGEMCQLELGDYGVNSLGFSLVAGQDIIDSNPDLVRRFVAANYDAWVAAIEDPEAAVDGMMEMFPEVDREWMEVGWQAIVDLYLSTENSSDLPFGCVAPEDVQQTYDVLVQYQGMETDLSPADFFNNEFHPDPDCPQLDG